MTDIIERITQPGALRVIGMMLSFAGYTVSDGLLSAVSTFVLAGLGVWEIARDEFAKKDGE